jgi:hypothetical protein
MLYRTYLHIPTDSVYDHFVLNVISIERDLECSLYGMIC